MPKTTRPSTATILSMVETALNDADALCATNFRFDLFPLVGAGRMVMGPQLPKGQSRRQKFETTYRPYAQETERSPIEQMAIEVARAGRAIYHKDYSLALKHVGRATAAQALATDPPITTVQL